MKSSLPKRSENYTLWYTELVKKAELIEHTAVRGCMIMRPYGYAIWEAIQAILDKAFKKTGHTNAYFPLLIPKSYLSKEAKHVDGFAKECAVVTHYRLKNGSNNEGVVVDPSAKLEEELIIRPTSEAIIWHTYKKWIQSYRDLPLLINQWANVVRWEMRTRPFIRSSEFLWQEGHTAHATKQEAQEEVQKMLQLYTDFAAQYMAIPVLQGIKTPTEKFAGAEETYTIEMLMQDGKALQAGTAHFLGQNFSKAFDVTFANKTGKLDYVWGTSWGVTVRLIGAMIMVHSDDDGLILPPKLAPIQVVIVPIYNTEQERTIILEKAAALQKKLLEKDVLVQIDHRDTHKPGWKFAHYELKGVPIRIVIGPKDVRNHTVELARRDTKEKMTISFDQALTKIISLLDTIQQNMYQKATQFLKDNTHYVDDYATFKKIIAEQGGFISAYWDGTPETEEKIKLETKATIRCIPLQKTQEKGLCIYTGKPAQKRVFFAKAY